MKRVNKKMWLCLACACMGAPLLMAQDLQTQVIEDIKTPSGSEDLLYFTYGGRAMNNTAKVFKKNTPVYFQAASLPRFAIIGKKKKYYLGIGGYVKGTISYDFNGIVENPIDFITSDISVPRSPGNGAKIQGSAATSNLFFNFVGLPGTADEIGAYFNANFAGPNQTFQLQYAYITYRNFMMGYNTSLFTDAGAITPTIDFEGPNAATFVYNTLLSYTYKFNKNWSLAASVEMPMVSATTGTDVANVTQRVPDIPLYLQYAWNDGSSWMRASSIFRSMMYRNQLTSENRSKFGWGVKLSGTAKLSRCLHLYYQGVYGKGISNYIQDINGLGLDMVANQSKPGEMSRVEVWGAYMGLQYNFSKNVFMTCTYSQDRDYMPSGVTAAPDTYKYAQYVVTNVFWNILPNLQTGVEYLWGRRTNMDGASGKANRIQTMLQLNF